jgi:VanZ family protein
LSNIGIKRLVWWLLSAAHMALIWYFSSRSGFEVGLPSPWDKVAHFGTYALLGFLLVRASNSARVGFGFAAIYGIIDEVHQGFVPLRDSSLWDWVADAFGAALGVVLGSWISGKSETPPAS